MENAPWVSSLEATGRGLVGGGFFVLWTKLPYTFAWDVFGQNNDSSAG